MAELATADKVSEQLRLLQERINVLVAERDAAQRIADAAIGYVIARQHKEDAPLTLFQARSKLWDVVRQSGVPV